MDTTNRQPSGVCSEKHQRATEPAHSAFRSAGLWRPRGALQALAVALSKADSLPGVGFAARYLVRHAMGDWGELDAEDRATNDRALAANEHLLSVYTLPGGEKLWILTEADRSVTTLLLRRRSISGSHQRRGLAGRARLR